jgi:hypothetical protein
LCQECGVIVNVEVVYRNKILKIADHVALDMTEFDEDTQDNMAQAFEKQFPLHFAKVPTWTQKGVTFKPKLIFTEAKL